MPSQTDIFSKRVGEFMLRSPPTGHATESCTDIVSKLRVDDHSSVVIVDAEGRPVGIVTENDVTRRITFEVPPDAPITAVMSSPVWSIGLDDYVYLAVGRMRRLGLHHLPVVDGHGCLAGMVDLDDALAVVSEALIDRIDRLTHDGDLPGMKAIKGAQVEIAGHLLDDGLAAPDILALISHVNSDIHRRLTDRAIDEMRDSGDGGPPVPFAVIVMGSAGRGESLLAPDQDNGIIVADYDDADHTSIDAWFIGLAERLTRSLAAVGFPLCKGGVMATNPVWRKTLPQWRRQVRLWSRKQSHAAILLSDIFFDFIPVCGDYSLATELRGHVTDVMRQSHGLLQAMEEVNEDHGTSLGLFGHVRRERRGPHKGRVNLKHAGTLPLVGSIRLLALHRGIAAVSTLERAAGLRAAGVLDGDTHDDLVAAFHHLTKLLLRQQIADFEETGSVSNYVALGTLRRLERRRLVDALRAIEALRDSVRNEITGNVF